MVVAKKIFEMGKKNSKLKADEVKELAKHTYCTLIPCSFVAVLLNLLISQYKSRNYRVEND